MPIVSAPTFSNKQPRFDNVESKRTVLFFIMVECRKKIYFFPTSAASQEIRIEEESQLNQSLLLLSKLLICCRFGDNILFGLINHFCSQVDLSTSENKLAKNTTKVISTRVTERFTELLKQYCRQDAYINCSDLIRDALREIIRRDAPDLYNELLEGDKKSNDRKTFE